MHPALMGALVGLGLAMAIYAFDYMMVSRNAAERAARFKKKAELDQTERGGLISLVRFLIFLPPGMALLFWMLS
jgi:hypothetical protein